MDKPFSLLLFPFILGILFTYFFETRIGIVLLLLVFLIAYLLYNIIKGSLNQRILLFLFFLLGIIMTYWKNSSRLVNLVDESHDFFGFVEEIVRSGEDRTRYIVRIEGVDGFKIPKERTVVSIIGQSQLKIGNRFSFRGSLRLPAQNTNPNLYNYRLSLKSQSIHTSLSLKDSQIKSIDRSSYNFFYKLKSKLLGDIEELFNKHLDPRQANLINSILLGKSSYLEEDYLKLYRKMGLAHILAVSGLHIGLISGFTYLVFSYLGIKRGANIFLSLGVIWTYGFLIGFPPSVLRANIIFSLIYYSKLIHKPYDPLNTLSLAAFIILLINPFYLFNIGFQLSFLATLAILLLVERIEAYFYPYRNKLTASLSAVLGVQLGLLPVQAYYFNRINLMTILANLILVPLLSFSLILALIMLVFSYSLAFLNNFLGLILNTILGLQFIILDFLGKISLNDISLASPGLFEILFYYILLAMAFKFIDLNNLNHRLLRSFMIFLSLIIGLNIFIFWTNDFLELHFIDVGQGDAILIRTARSNYLMDTGGSLFGDFDIGENITLPYLEKLGIKSLDAVFISHFHEDHCQGLGAILQGLKVKRILASYEAEEGDLKNKIREKGLETTILTRGDRLRLDRDISLDILWPLGKQSYISNENNRSLVGLLSYGNFTCLLTGDLEKEGEDQLVDKFKAISLLKVGHHGSPTSSSQEFLEALRPKYAIISLGRNNSYGHPGEDVLDRLKNLKTKVYRTDENGLVLLRLEGKNYSIKPFLKNGEKKRLGLGEFLEENLYSLAFYAIIFILVYIELIIASRGGLKNELQ